MVGPLRNPRQEQFARGIAAGVTPPEAYVSAGYSRNGASPSAGRLLRNALIRARVAELQQAVADSVVERCALSREWVLERLKQVVIRSMIEEDFQPAGANRALELLGRELGMFVDRTEHTVWNGDPSTLSAAQQARLMTELEKAAFRDDPAGLEEWRRKKEAASQAQPSEPTPGPVQ
jgi:Terminase small subunit